MEISRSRIGILHSASTIGFMSAWLKIVSAIFAISALNVGSAISMAA
jgi:hypothetical protein